MQFIDPSNYINKFIFVMKVSFARTQSLPMLDKHCSTCQCSSENDFFKWRKQKKVNQHTFQPISPILESKVQQFNVQNPDLSQSRMSSERKCWYRSVSPRRPTIKIKVSTPNSPNLFPSQTFTQTTKRDNGNSFVHTRNRSDLPISEVSGIKSYESLSTQISPFKNNSIISKSQVINTEADINMARMRPYEHTNNPELTFRNNNGFYKK